MRRARARREQGAQGAQGPQGINGRRSAGCARCKRRECLRSSGRGRNPRSARRSWYKRRSGRPGCRRREPSYRPCRAQGPQGGQGTSGATAPTVHKGRRGSSRAPPALGSSCRPGTPAGTRRSARLSGAERTSCTSLARRLRSRLRVNGNSGDPEQIYHTGSTTCGGGAMYVNDGNGSRRLHEPQ